MIPESEHILNTLVVRDMRLPPDVTLTRASLIRWLALALGLINPNESRKYLIDLIEVMLDMQLREHRGVQVSEIMNLLEKKGTICSEKTVRYHLLRLEKRGILQRNNKEYSFVISDTDDAGLEAMLKSYDQRYSSAMDKIRMAITKLKGMY